jgi:hypothetical protein
VVVLLPDTSPRPVTAVPEVADDFSGGIGVAEEEVFCVTEIIDGETGPAGPMTITVRALSTSDGHSVDRAGSIGGALHIVGPMTRRRRLEARRWTLAVEQPVYGISAASRTFVSGILPATAWMRVVDARWGRRKVADFMLRLGT